LRILAQSVDKVLNETPETALFDCQNMAFFANLVHVNALPLEKVGYFKI
jgi:hypothetical protein